MYLFPAIYLRQLNINILPSMHPPYVFGVLFIFKYILLPFLFLLFNNMLTKRESCMPGYQALVDNFSCEADQNKYIGKWAKVAAI